MIYDSILGLIGNTPMVRTSSLNPNKNLAVNVITVVSVAERDTHIGYRATR